jgi:DNA-binding transcriptional MocR family regulator
MPDGANPTGARLSAAGRRRLAATLWQQGVRVVVDEVATGLHLDDDPELPPFAAGLPDAATITVGSLAKSVWGGLRVGWLRTEAALAEQLRAAFSLRQLSVGVVDQLAAVALLPQLDTVLARRRAELRERRDVLRAELARLLPDWAVPRPEAGLSLWCRLPTGVSSAALVAAAAPHGLVLAEGRAFGTGSAFDDHLRLPFTLPPDRLREAAALLARAAEGVRPRPGAPVPARVATVV